RRQEPQAETQKGPGKNLQAVRRSTVIKFRVEFQKAAAAKPGEREAKEEKNALEISLAAMPEDQDHPEKREQRAGGKNDESKVRHCGHEVCSPRSLSLNWGHGNGQV